MKTNKFISRAELSERAYVTPNWVSNGFWAMKYGAFGYGVTITPDVVRTIAPKCFSILEKEDSIITPLIPAIDLIAFKKTSFIQDTGNTNPARVFISEDQTTFALIAEKYVAAAEFDVLYGRQPNGPFVNAPNPDDVTFLVMPIRSDKSFAFPVLVPAVEESEVVSDDAAEVRSAA
jgi:hypothetical protein